MMNSALSWTGAAVGESVQCLGYVLDDWGSISGKGWDFTLPHSVKTGSETHPASYPMGTGGRYVLTPGIKRPGREVPRLRMRAAIYPLPNMSPWRGA
jgi:hypothetical protein